jgi:ABC-2 type transport system permease protein
MGIAKVKNLLSFFNPSNLTGPILDKELRVSSRRKRNYFLRSIYILLLLLIMVLFWVEEVYSGGSFAYRSSRMSEIGKFIVLIIVWFQFIGSQFLAVVMLSSAISDEIYHKTLGVLMTTPISSFQIVFGKLFSKLLQLILLIAISFPLLAVVRIFGGIPWDYCFTSLCITLSTIIFVGSVSLFFSIFCRRAYASVIAGLLSVFTLFALVPLLLEMIVDIHSSPDKFLQLFFHCNPYFLLGYTTDKMMQPGGVAGIVVFWPVCCIVLLSASAFILTASVIFVRRVALRQITGWQGGAATKKRSALKSSALNPSSRIRTVTNQPVLWKELHWPLLGRHKKIAFCAILGSVIIIVFTYTLCLVQDTFSNKETHVAYSVIFVGFGLLFTIVIPATTITTEKEAASWQLLLTTTQTDWQIIIAKFIGALRRCIPAWFFLFAHLIFFSLCGFIHPAALILMAMLVTWLIVFLSASGLYFSSRFKHTTTAVIMNFALAGALWALAPFLIGLSTAIMRCRENLLTLDLDFNPFVQAIVIMLGASGHSYWYSSLDFDWPNGPHSLKGIFFMMLAFLLFYGLLALFLLWRAKSRIRKKIF